MNAAANGAVAGFNCLKEIADETSEEIQALLAEIAQRCELALEQGGAEQNVVPELHKISWATQRAQRIVSRFQALKLVLSAGGQP